jgi:hypothetical protein
MGNTASRTGTPTAALRKALSDLLHEAKFTYDAKTRALISKAEKALVATQPTVVHEKAVGVFRYNKEEHAYMPVVDELAFDPNGDVRPGCEYLFRQSPSLVM